MSPPHTHTVDVAGASPPLLDEEEDDICPLCIGECTCSEGLRSSTLPFDIIQNTPPHSSSPPIASTSQITTDNTPRTNVRNPILKIKLTLPPTLLGKRKAPSEKSSFRTSNGDADVYSAPAKSSPVTQDLFNKRRGRPPKALVAARRAARAQGFLPSTKNTIKGSRKPQPKKLQKKKATLKKQRRPPSNASSSSLSELTEDDDDLLDTRALNLPTFVEASMIESSVEDSSADDSDSSLSGFDTDSEMEMEEENFILAEEKARVRRELLYQGRPPHVPPRTNHPRGSQSDENDVRMNDDSDATEEDEDEEAEDEDGGDDEDEPDERGRWVGVATTWSDNDNDSDESSFDADIFFANLSGSDDESSEMDFASSSGNEGGEDGDQSDLDDISIGDAAASILPHLRRDLEEIPFEIAEGWDGQIIFTSGSLNNTQDIIFRQPSLPPDPTSPFATEPPPTESPSQDSEDVEMAEGSGFTTEDEDAFLQPGDGDTTDEELVDHQGRPNARAMQLFNTPFKGTLAVNPLSTLSPSVSPMIKRSKTPRAGPILGNFLGGRLLWDNPEDHEDEFDVDNTRVVSSSHDGTPRRGQFDMVEDKRRTVIDGTSNTTPCAFPRRRPRGKSLLSQSSSGSHDQFDGFLRKSFTFPRPGSMPPPSSTRSLHMPSSSTEFDPADFGFSSEQAIELDDVLDASFLDPEPTDYFGDAPLPSTEAESRKHMRNLSRWDLISVGAFRKNTEATSTTEAPAGWGSDSATDYGNVIRSSPLTAMMWHNKTGITDPANSRLSVNTAESSLLPLRDGDRTPTNVNSLPQTPQRKDKQTRKEQRKERKLQRKSQAQVNRPQHHQHQHHHKQHRQFHHQHLPNSKSRSNNAMQRNFSSPVAGGSSNNN